MSRQMSMWGALSGLISGVLIAWLNESLYFWYAGLIFAVLFGASVWIYIRGLPWKRVSTGRGISALLIVGVVAPLAGIVTTALIDGLIFPTTPYAGVRQHVPVTILLGASVLPTSAWAFCLAASLKLFAGKWDWRFVWQMIVGGTCAWALALVIERGNFHINFVIPFLVSGLLATGFLLGAGLERQISRSG